VNPETNWFATCRDSNLEIIGPMLGYYLRRKAEHFCKNLSAVRNVYKNFDNVDNVLSVCDKAVLPFIVEVSVAERTVKQLEKFVHLSDDTMSSIKMDEATSDNLSRNMVIHEIRQEYHDWAWSCLNTGNVIPLTENVPKSRVNMSPQMFESASRLVSHSKSRYGRLIKKKRFFE